MNTDGIPQELLGTPAPWDDLAQEEALPPMPGLEFVNHAYCLKLLQARRELEGLLLFLKAIKPSNILEIGTLTGATFFCWCQVATGKKISIDLPGGMGGVSYTQHHMELRNARMSAWSEDVHCFLGSSRDLDIVRGVRDLLDGERLDFLFIDGDHQYEHVKRDFELYSPMVRDGGIVAFHDVENCEYHPNYGVLAGKFWKELCGDQLRLTSERMWGGIGVLFV